MEGTASRSGSAGVGVVLEDEMRAMRSLDWAPRTEGAATDACRLIVGLDGAGVAEGVEGAGVAGTERLWAMWLLTRSAPESDDASRTRSERTDGRRRGRSLS